MTGFDDEAQRLYRAYSAAYQAEAKDRNLKFGLDVALSVLAAVVVLLRATGNDEGSIYQTLTDWVPLIAVGWLIVRETGLFPNTVGKRMTAVKIQQQFELRCRLGDDWRSWWNALLLDAPPTDRSIRAHATKFSGHDIAEDYFVDTSHLEPNTAALLRVEQSAGWGAHGHRRYARCNRYGAAAVIAALIAVCSLVSLDLPGTAAVAMSVSSLIVGRLQSARTHAELHDRRCRLERYVQSVLDRIDPRPSDGETIAVLDELCRLRLVDRRIPEWLYKRYWEQDQTAVDDAVSDHALRLREQTAPTDSGGD